MYVVASAQSHSSRLNHDESSDQTRSKVTDRPDDGDAETAARSGWESDQDDPARRLPIGVDELAEVLVLGQQDASAGSSKLQDDFVRGSTGDFGYGDDIVTIGTQSANGCKVAALIRQELHGQELAVTFSGTVSSRDIIRDAYVSAARMSSGVRRG